MGLFGFSFGKKRRVSKRKTQKAARKPPARLLRLCKKYHVKATKKVGSKRVYKKVAVLKKLCLRKARALRKKLMKMQKKAMKKHHKKTHKKSTKRRSHRKMRMGEEESMYGMKKTMFGRRSRFGEEITKYDVAVPRATTKDYNDIGRNVRNFAEMCTNKKMTPQLSCIADTLRFGSRRRVPMFGNWMDKTTDMLGMTFGKRRSTTKVSKKTAMKAFRSFYKRHCAGSRRSGFGNGGNPALSYGYEFCPDGKGGVLGFNSTGLFPSPCTSYSSSAPTMGALPPPTKVSEGGFGRRRPRRRTAAAGKRKSAIGSRKRRNASGCTAAGKSKLAVGGRKRRSTRKM